MSRSPVARISRQPFRLNFSPAQRAHLQTGVQINLPAQGFDPSKATDEQLAAHFFPPRPNAASAPRAHAQWMDVMARVPIWPDLAAADAEPARQLFARSLLLTQLRSATAPQIPSATASKNWSGAYAAPTDHSRVTRVQGIWTVPNPQPVDNSAVSYASSMWIGLDGFFPASRSLPQVGTGQWVSVDNKGKRHVSIFAWWQWFVRDNPTNGQIVIHALPISVNDRVYAQVTAIAPAGVSIFIMNLTTRVAVPFWFNFAEPIQPPLSATNPLPPRIEGMTASWVLERPAPLARADSFTLPNYGNAHFEFCLAGTDASGPTQDLDVRQANLLRMVEWKVDPPSAKLVSSCDRDGDFGIRLRYGRP